MGLDIGAIGAGAAGLSQGMSQGFELANQYQQIQAERDKQRKLKQVEAVGLQIAQEGLFQKDPDMALSKMRDAYVSVGELDKAQQYQQQLVTNQEAAQKKMVGEAWERLQIGDYEGAVSNLNEVYAKKGGGTKLTYATGPDGKPTISGMAAGKEFAKNYSGDPMELKSDLADRIAYLFMGPEAAMEMDLKRDELESKQAVAQSTIDVNTQNVAESKALLPGKMAREAAETQQAIDTGAAARVTAGASAQRAKNEAALAPTQQRKAIAEAEGLEAQNELRDQDAMMTYLKNNPPGGDVIMKPGQTPPLHNDPDAVGEIGLMIRRNNGTDIGASAQQATEVLEKGQDVDVNSGVIMVAGVPVTVGKEAAAAYLRQLTARQAPNPNAVP